MLVVCSLANVPKVVSDYQPSHVISLLGSNHEMPQIGSVAGPNHLKLGFNDISAPRDGFVPPGSRDVETLVRFARDWDRASPMLIHCWAGISRSTAGAFITRCALNPAEDEMAIADELRAASPPATPNRLMVSLADDLLGRGGRMRDAVTAIGRGAEAWEGNVFTLPAG